MDTERHDRHPGTVVERAEPAVAGDLSGISRCGIDTQTRPVQRRPGSAPTQVDPAVDLYVVAAKSAAQWASDAGLLDVRGGAQAISIVSGGIEDNTFVADAGSLSGTFGTDVGVGYDVVLDLDQDGQLGAGDFIDGLSEAIGS